MMKVFSFGFIMVLLGLPAFAQAPQQFSFQGVARKADGKLAGNATVSIRITMHSETAGGTAVYQETHTAQTNASGIFNIRIGGGAVVSGSFADISWKTFPYFLQLEMDPLGGATYTDLGTTQMLSVPYAIQAAEATKWNDGYPVVQRMALGPGLTMLRSGNLGVGGNVVTPEFPLDVGGRVRIRHNGAATSGIYFNNSQNVADAFTGLKTDTQIGFFINGAWRFWIDNAGNGTLGGTLTQSSDRRLKRDFSPLSASLQKLTGLEGYHYYWKEKERDQSLQTGLIAQDVEKLFPELVKTDDKGFKSLNYTGLIPHLIESVKHLAKQNAKLEAENVVFNADNKSIHDN